MAHSARLWGENSLWPKRASPSHAVLEPSLQRENCVVAVKVLISGSHGLVGSALVSEFQRRGDPSSGSFDHRPTRVSQTYPGIQWRVCSRNAGSKVSTPSFISLARTSRRTLDRGAEGTHSGQPREEHGIARRET